MSVVNANPLMLGDAGYNIGRSLRFRSSASAYLSRTIGTTSSRTTWTWSGWIKRGKLSAVQRIFSGINGANDEFIRFTSSDTIEFFLTSSAADVITTQVFRDPSAYYHLIVAIDTTQATAANRVRMYVNGSQITAFGTATYPTQNYLMNAINVSGVSNEIGTYRLNLTTEGFDGYLAEVNFIDGQALTPSSFGQTDPVTGVWTPKKYAGTYGTNGFYLPFSDNTSATTLAYDKSGNGNNWTPNNISTTSGATYDSMTDVPTLTSATAANYCVISPISRQSNVTIADGNLTQSYAGTANTGVSQCTIAVSSGKWYYEHTVGALGGGDFYIGVMLASVSPVNTAVNYINAGTSGAGEYAYRFNAQKGSNGTYTAYGATYTTGDIIGVALDMDGGSITFYKNNVSQGTAFTGISGTYVPFVQTFSGATAYLNFGQRPFSYTPPTGFKALNTFNLPDPTIKKPNQYMDATLWSGDNTASRNISNAASFQPDLVWVKCRSTAGQSHNVVDSVRGLGTNVMNTLYTEKTDSETGVNTNASLGPYYGAVGAITSTGFTLTAGSGGTTDQVNKTGSTYVGWQWKKGATPGFDIVTYTGTGAAQNISHSLGVAPKMIITKARSSTVNWQTYHASLPLPQSSAVYLDLTQAVVTGYNNYWNSTAPTSSVFTVGDWISVSSTTYVAYLFAEIAGFSKFGSYTGNGSANGPFVFTNFRPRWIMAKRTDTAGTAWAMFDAVRDIDNPDEAVLAANSSGAETSTAGFGFDFNSNGFKVRATDPTLNASGGTYIYAAFAENPFKYSLAR